MASKPAGPRAPSGAAARSNKAVSACRSGVEARPPIVKEWNLRPFPLRAIPGHLECPGVARSLGRG
ncbi:MAG: hypothetical protein MI919_24650, partial [Holophagales bacterium]|nr:hypothetical protein [Holophagales bacterium]